MTTITTELKIAITQQKVVELHHFISPDTYSVGYVLALGKDYCLVKSVDQDGKLNGILVIKISDIYAVIFESDYLKVITVKSKLAKRMQYYDLLSVEQRLQALDMNQSNFLTYILLSAFLKKEVISIGFIDDAELDATVTGVIKTLDDRQIVINYVDDYYLSSLWTLTCMQAQINYLRIGSFQTIEYEALMNELFDKRF